MRTLGIKRKPLSSRNTRWAPRRAAFFYPGPFLDLPPRDRRFVALAGPALRRLPTPPEPLPQELPDADQAVAHTELPFDQSRNACEGPQLGAVPGGARPPQEQPPQALLLDAGQPRRASRGRASPEPSSGVAAMRLLPSHDRTQRHPDHPRHFAVWRAVSQQSDRLASSLLQLGRCAKWSHDPQRSSPWHSCMHYLDKGQ